MPKPPLSVEEIIAESGHAHHSRAVKALRDLGWKVTVSPYYSDNFTDKPREIDIIAEKGVEVVDRFNSVRHGFIWVRLYIECKYVPSPTVFCFDDKDMPQAAKLVGGEFRMNAEQLRSHGQGHVLHHLESIPVAKLFSSDPARREDSEAFARAINQTLNGLIFYRNREVALRRPNVKISGRLSFPIILLNSFAPLHQTSMGGHSSPTPITKPFQLEVNYAYRSGDSSQSEYFLIDVVSLDNMAEFLRSLEQNEVAVMVDYIREEERRRSIAAGPAGMRRRCFVQPSFLAIEPNRVRRRTSRPSW